MNCLRVLSRRGMPLLILLTTLLLSSCKPVVTFTGQSLLDASGNEYGQLSWNITGETDDEFQLTGVTIEPDIGAVEPQGSLKVDPAERSEERRVGKEGRS